MKSNRRLNPTTARRLKNFENAVRNHEMKYGGDPEDYDEIEAAFKAARKSLVEHLIELQGGPVKPAKEYRA